MRAMCLTQMNGRKAVWLNPLAIESFAADTYAPDGRAVGTCIFPRGGREEGHYAVAESPEEVAELFELAIAGGVRYVLPGSVPEALARQLVEAEKTGGKP